MMFKRIVLILTILALLIPSSVYAQDSAPWDQVFDENGDLRDDLVDLGVTTETPDWMSVDLPFGQSIDLEANYHRYQTADGNIVILPSASTLFFMAMNPQESGLADAVGSMGNGYAGLISFLGAVAGDSVDWNKVMSDHPEFKTPDQFWGAVLSGNQNVWTYFSGWGFITTLLTMSWNDSALRTAYLMYLNGAQNCAGIPGGCSGVVNEPPPQPVCPGPKVTMQQPTLSIRKIAPNNPLVVGQDSENRRGADILASVTIPPVIFTWYEPIYEEEEICRAAGTGETPDCILTPGNTVNDGITDTELVFKECREHVEHLPDAVANMQATANLDAASKAWITSKLGQTHYGAYIHRENFNLIPGMAAWTGGCSGGTCIATGQVLNVPFADPGTFNLRLDVVTTGTRFMGISITQPRRLNAKGSLQVFVTLPALVP